MIERFVFRYALACVGQPGPLMARYYRKWMISIHPIYHI